MTMHAKEPWRIEVKPHYGSMEEYLDLVDSAGISIVDVGSPCRDEGSYPDLSREDAERIVACVNACRGIPTEVLARGNVKMLVEMAQQFSGNKNNVTATALCVAADAFALDPPPGHLDSGSGGRKDCVQPRH